MSNLGLSSAPTSSEWLSEFRVFALTPYSYQVFAKSDGQSPAKALLKSLHWRRARVEKKKSFAIHKRFLLLLGVALGSYVPAAAQSPTPQVLLAQERLEPIMPMLRAVPAPLPATFFPLLRGPRESPADFRPLLAATYKSDLSPEHLLPMEKVRTLFVKQSSLPLVQLWGGRLQLDAFQSTLQLQNVQLGPSGSGGLQDFRPQRQPSLGSPRSFGLYGVSLRFRLGRHVQTGDSIHLWRCLAGIVGSGHTCPR